MKSVTQLKSLSDIRTIISTHTRSVPRHKGSNYLDILSLGMEKQRLEAELEWLSKRQRRIEGRLAEIRENMEKLLTNVGEESPSCPSAPTSTENHTREHSGSLATKWKKMTIEY